MCGGFCINAIEDQILKSVYTKEILEQLPDWFANEKARDEYAEAVKTLSYWAAFQEDGRGIGFEPLITLTEMWDKKNPCLIMIKML